MEQELLVRRGSRERSVEAPHSPSRGQRVTREPDIGMRQVSAETSDGRKVDGQQEGR